MTHTTTNYKPVIAVSACLMGQNVRYDGGNKYNKLIEETLKPIAQLMTFCPEVAAGLGTPRPPVKLIIQETGERRAVGVNDSSLDFTNALVKVSNNYVILFANVDGIIFKARSPSCGLDDTNISEGESIFTGSGIFSNIIATSCKHIKLIDEQKFSDPRLRKIFLDSLFTST